MPITTRSLAAMGRVGGRHTLKLQEKENRAPGIKPAAVKNASYSRPPLRQVSNQTSVKEVPEVGSAQPSCVPAKLAQPTSHNVVAKPTDAGRESVTQKGQVFSMQSAPAKDNCKGFSNDLLHGVLGDLDIDKKDLDNPLLVGEHVNQIYDYMRSLEGKYKVEPKFLEGKEINGKMRAILVDWLIQVHQRFKLLQETLYLTVSILDRFLQKSIVQRQKLQLVGVTAMLLASKYEEMYAPEVGDFVYITDNAYTKETILEMEYTMLRTLDFRLGKPIPLAFLRRYSKAGELDTTKHGLAKYFMELCTVSYDMVHVAPSELAAASLCLSIKVLGDATWNRKLQFHSKYTEAALMPVMKKIAPLVKKANLGKQTAVYKKYSSSKLGRVSTLPELQDGRVEKVLDANQ